MTKKKRTNPFRAEPERKDVIRGVENAPGSAPGDAKGYTLHIAKRD